MPRPVIYGPDGEQANAAPVFGFVPAETKTVWDRKPAPAPIPPPRDLPERSPR